LYPFWKAGKLRRGLFEAAARATKFVAPRLTGKDMNFGEEVYLLEND
jgi:hypothetical protein